MRVLIAGGTGRIGQFLVAHAQAAGDGVTILSRRPPQDSRVGWHRFALGEPVTLPPHDALVHAAFDHVPGRYRGGEGDDPEGFRARNIEGSLALVRASAAAGARRAVFLSSRAVYDGAPGQGPWVETQPLAPTSLYGAVKLAVEQALPQIIDEPVSLRVTGVYGSARPGAAHKWQDLFADFAAGRPIDARAGTEVHGDDLAQAVQIALRVPAQGGRVFNVSDLMVDRADLLARYAARLGLDRSPPPHARTCPVPMDCAAIRAVGWKPGGEARLGAFLDEAAQAARMIRP